jgi:preprotein translocase subunit SecG
MVLVIHTENLIKSTLMAFFFFTFSIVIHFRHRKKHAQKKKRFRNKKQQELYVDAAYKNDELMILLCRPT